MKICLRKVCDILAAEKRRGDFEFSFSECNSTDL